MSWLNLDGILELVKKLKEGDYCECGVFQGDSARRIARAMVPGATLWLFDPLIGHRPPSKWDHHGHHEGRYKETSREEIFKGMPPDKSIVLTQGYVPEVLPTVENCKFRLVHLDMDHYWPYKTAIPFFKPRMVKGGYMVFDDWQCSDTPGCHKAVIEEIGAQVPYWQNVE